MREGSRSFRSSFFVFRGDPSPFFSTGLRIAKKAHRTRTKNEDERTKTKTTTKKH